MELSKEHIHSTLIAIVVGASGLLAWWWLQQPNETGQEIVVEPTESEQQFVQVNVIVDVQGKVQTPGIVELPAGSRVIDAIEAAGGLLPRVTPGVNLARVLLDGEQIFVGEEVKQSNGKINLNTASASELEGIPGVGPVLASRIIEYRTTQGGFRSFEDVDAVSGVGPSLLAQLRQHATL